MKISPRDLAQVVEHDFTKELKNFEYEIKFTIQDDQRSSFEVLKEIRNCFTFNNPYTLCAIKNGDELLTNVSFYQMDETEYSTFSYRKARMVKIKKHKILHLSPFEVFKSDEKLIIDEGDFANNLKDFSQRFARHNYELIDLDRFLNQKKHLTFIGKMSKNRVKDFIVDNQDGRIYAVAVTFCQVGNQTQKQLEVEYSGFLDGFAKSDSNIEQTIIESLEKIGKFIYGQLPGLISPSIERKFDFVRRNNHLI